MIRLFPAFLFCGLAVSVTAVGGDATCWNYELEQDNSPGNENFASYKAQDVFGGRHAGQPSAAANPNALIYINSGTQGEPDEGGVKGLEKGPISKNASAGGGQWGKERYINQEPPLDDLLMARTVMINKKGAAGPDVDNVDGCSQKGAGIKDCSATAASLRKVSELNSSLNSGGGTVGIKNSLENLSQFRQGPGKKKIIAEIEPENTNEWKQYVQAAGNPQDANLVIYKNAVDPKTICGEAQKQGFHVIINQAGNDQSLTKSKNKCCNEL